MQSHDLTHQQLDYLIECLNNCPEDNILVKKEGYEYYDRLKTAKSLTDLSDVFYDILQTGKYPNASIFANALVRLSNVLKSANSSINKKILILFSVKLYFIANARELTDEVVHTVMMRMLGQNGEMKDASDIYRYACELGETDRGIHRAMLQLSCKNSDAEWLFKAFDNILDLGVVDDYSMDMVIMGAKKLDQLDKLFAMIDEKKNKNHSFFYNTLLVGLLKNNLITHAVELYKYLFQTKNQDERTYNLLIKYINDHDHKDTLLEFNKLILAMSEHGYHHDAFDLCRQLHKKNCVESNTYNQLFISAANRRDVETMTLIYRCMLEAGISKSVLHNTMILMGVNNEDNFYTALEGYQTAIERKELTMEIFENMMLAAKKHNRNDWLEDAERRGWSFKILNHDSVNNNDGLCLSVNSMYKPNNNHANGKNGENKAIINFGRK